MSQLLPNLGTMSFTHSTEPVSYTHLDVYKRQLFTLQPDTRFMSNYFSYTTSLSPSGVRALACEEGYFSIGISVSNQVSDIDGDFKRKIFFLGVASRILLPRNK